MKIKSFVLVLVMVLLCQVMVFATETNSVPVSEAILESNTIVEIDPTILTYKEAIEGIIQTVNKRDSYFFEIKNPNDYIQYVKDLGLVVPENVNKGLTRIEFVQLLVTLTEKVTNETNYSTELITITDIFTDLNDLSKETLNAIEVVFIEGLMGGKENNIFAPNEKMTKTSFEFVLDRLNQGYSREKLFSVVDSCFTFEEREEILVKYNSLLEKKNNEMVNSEVVDDILSDKDIVIKDIYATVKAKELVELLNKLEEKVVFNSSNMESFVLIKDVIDYFNVLWKTPGTLFNTTGGVYHYLANDTSFLSNEEWEYLNSHLDSEITLSEFFILYDRVKSLEKDMLELGYFDNWEKILKYSKNYLGFVYPMIETNKDCFNYFLDLDEISQNSKIKPTDFARTIHECQHEEFLTMSKASFSRKKSAGPWGTWSISPYRDPKMFYYLDYTTSFWADSEMNTELPATNLMYEHYPDYIKEDSKIVHYGTGEDSSSNALGIQGLLSEFCSFAVETKVQAVSFSLGMNSATFGSLDYDSYRKMELMVKDYIYHLQDTNVELYNSFMADSDVIRMINNIVKDLDYVESIYPWNMKHNTDAKLLTWENDYLLKR